MGTLSSYLMPFAALLLLGGCIYGSANADWIMRDSHEPIVVEVPSYDGIETRLLDGDLVNFRVAVSGVATAANASEYAECAAAQYTLIRGYGFARHLRTTVEEDGSLLRADAVYTISPDLPRGSRTIDAEVTVANCGLSGIPTV